MTIYTKICTKCKIPKLTIEFGKNKRSKDGLASWCKTCRKQTQEENSDYYRSWRKNNRERLNEYKKEYTKLNHDKIKQWKATYRENNRDDIREYMRDYREINRVELRTYHRNYCKNRYETDELFALKIRISSLIRGGLNRFNKGKTSNTIDILGCSIEEFKIHIESQFKEGMTWENRDEWHLDHITPVSWGTNEEEIVALNHFTNFQPLWEFDNLSKLNRWSG